MTPGIGQLLIIALIILVLFGAGRIPRLMSDIGKGITSFKKGMKEDTDNHSGENKTLPSSSDENKK